MIQGKSIQFRLVLSFLFVCLLFSGPMYFSVYSIQHLSRMQDEGGLRFHDVDTVFEVIQHVGGVYGVMADAAINRKFEETDRELKKLKEVYVEDLKKIEKCAGDSSKKTLAKLISDGYGSYLELFEKEQLPELKDHVEITAKARELDAKLDEIREKLIATLNKFQDSLMKESEATDMEFDSVAHSAFLVSVFGAIISTILAFLIGYFNAKSIAGRLNRVSGNISAFVSRLNSLVVQLGSAVNSLNDASTLQASAIQETSASMEEVKSMISKTADNAVQSAEISQKSSEKAQRGEDASTRMMGAVEEIRKSHHRIESQVGDSNKKIGELVKIISDISNKTKVINEIVFQTKLLSFNASVEAARAGEHGKGFAVVAEEVGNLANMSGSAAKDISEMLDASVRTVNKTVSDSQNSIQQIISEGESVVAHGQSVAQETGMYLHEINDGVKIVNIHSAEIATATKEQAIGIQQITEAIQQLDQAAQQNSTSTKEIFNSSEEIDQLGKDLGVAVLELNTLVQGVRHAA